MSYSVTNQCWNCSKSDKCTDVQEVERAVQSIHERSYEQGHQGAGVIVLACHRQNEEQK